MRRCQLCQTSHRPSSDCQLGGAAFSAWVYVDLDAANQQHVYVCPCPDLRSAHLVRDFFWDMFEHCTAGADKGLPPIPSAVLTRKPRVYRWTPFYLELAEEWGKAVGWEDG